MSDFKISKVVLVILCAFLISTFLFSLVVDSCIDPYLKDTKRELAVFNFYEEQDNNNLSKNPNSKCIYFIGCSQTRQGVDAYSVEDYLKEANCSSQIFNIGVDADTPLKRITEINNIIETKPDLVVLCLSYRSFFAPVPEDKLYLAHYGTKIDEEDCKLFNEEQLKIIRQNDVGRFFDKRRYFVSSVKFLLKDDGRYYFINNFKNPGGLYGSASEEEVQKIMKNPESEIMSEFVPDRDAPENQIIFEQQKKALKYTIEKLEENGIHVVIINMPLNPKLSEKISESTRENVSSFLKSIDTPYYDFETNYPQEYFWDLNHMNIDGRSVFSTDISKILSDEIKNLNEKGQEGKKGRYRIFQSEISEENPQSTGSNEGFQTEVVKTSEI
jgi:vacuolar-type H+-ATPase subunit F/Vma7